MTQIKCAQCNSLDIREKAVYFDRRATLLGEWPLYYFGAGPNNPQDATEYFCGVVCANKFHRKTNDATAG